MAKRRNRRNRVSEREREVARRKAKVDQMKKFILPIALIIIVGFGISMAMRGGDVEPQPTDSVYVNELDQVEVDASEITTSARYYSYDAGSKEVRFFALRGSDGRVRVALDACDVCYSAKKGYVQDGNVMKCNNCGNRYATDGIGTKNVNGGGCWPGYVPMLVQDGKLLIDTKDLQAKTYMF